MLKTHLRFLVLLMVGTAVVLTGCSLPQRVRSTPTLDLTKVYGTLAVMMTTQPARTDQAEVTATPAAPSLTPRASATRDSSLASATISPTLSGPCDRAAAGSPIDVTIPDDSIMEPGAAFTKIWRLENVGSCTWTTGYSATFFYGDRMDAPAVVPLSQAIPPGETVEIAVEMVAPFMPGTYQGNWKLSNASGVLFGIGPNGDAPFWVRIVVPVTLPGTPSPTPTRTLVPVNTPTPTPTPTATPPVQVSATLILNPLTLIDLDTLETTAPGADLEYQTGANNYHWLMPIQTALLGVYGSLEPSLDDCLDASMSSAPIAVESLSIRTYLCYRTGQGATGRAQLIAIDSDTYALTLDLLTWALP